jgi:hypothetical protein
MGPAPRLREAPLDGRRVPIDGGGGAAALVVPPPAPRLEATLAPPRLRGRTTVPIGGGGGGTPVAESLSLSVQAVDAAELRLVCRWIRRGLALPPVGAGGGGGTPNGAGPLLPGVLRTRCPDGRKRPPAGGFGGASISEAEEKPSPPGLPGEPRVDFPRGRGRRGASVGSGTSCSGGPPALADRPFILPFMPRDGRACPCSETGGGGGSEDGAPASPAMRSPRYLRTMYPRHTPWIVHAAALIELGTA